MKTLLTAIVSIFKSNTNPRQKQPHRGAAVRLAISSQYSAQSFADILSKYMEGANNEK